MISFLGMKKKATLSEACLRLSVVVPVFNEEIDIPRNIPVLYKFLSGNFRDYSWEIVIADNGPSKDATARASKQLAKKYSGIKYKLIPRPGRGGALKEAWMQNPADYLVYMDVDLSSDLKFLPKLVSELQRGSDIAIGSRLAKGSRVYGRTFTRELMSRAYNILIKLAFQTSFNDAQCGFKGIRKEAAAKLLPHVKDSAWFFDSELLILAEKSGFRVVEVPIVWRDDPRSTVKVAKTAWGDMRGLARLFVTRPWRKVKR